MDYTRNWLKRNPENFPVASWLLPAEARAPILAFYSFARGADEMADNAKIPADKRRQALLALEEALVSGKTAALPGFALKYEKLARLHPPLLTYGRDLLSAFVQDTLKTRYHDYNDLLDYCQRSAAPVGRAMLYLCGEVKADLQASDALCDALQLLNHIQDCSDDYVNRDRVYLPLDWFMLANTNVGALAASEANQELRLVLDRALDNCDALLARAKPLLASVQERRVRWEVTFIYKLALRLCKLLRKRDPLQAKVKLGKLAIYVCLTEVLLGL